MWFDKIKSYFDTGLWSVEMVSNVVAKGKITPEQYKEIIEEEYTPGVETIALEDRVNTLENDKADKSAVNELNEALDMILNGVTE